MDEPMAARSQGVVYLESLLNKMLVVHLTDGRLVRGLFKCTDPDCNIVLSHTTEYRQPTRRQREAAAMATASTSGRIVLDMETRDLGLAIVPGPHIVRIEEESFASQNVQR